MSTPSEHWDLMLPLPPEDVIEAVRTLNGGCSRERALQIIAADIRDLTALRSEGGDGPW